MDSTTPAVWKCGGVVHSSPTPDTPKPPITKTTKNNKTNKPKTPVTRRHRNKPGINELHDASTKNAHCLRRRPTRTLIPNFYNEKRLAYRAAGTNTEARKETELPTDEASVNIQHDFDHSSPYRVAQLKAPYPAKFTPDGQLQNRKVYPTLPYEKLKTLYERKCTLPKGPGINIREEYRYGSAMKRREMRGEYPEYAEYFRSRKATRIAKVRRAVEEREKEEEEVKEREEPGINQREEYRHSTAAQKARLRKELPGLREWYDGEDRLGGAVA